MINPIKLSPFQKFCVTIGMIPSSYKASLTYEEQLMWLCNYLENTVIPAIDNNAEALEEVQNLFTELQNYVNNYFDNLDIQQEINQKLDEMAEDGTLSSLIENYIDPFLTNMNQTLINQNNNIQTMNNNLNNRLTIQDNKINNLVNNPPSVVSSVNDMTDTSKIYVLSNNGYWYYYNGTEWAQGGVYQATQVQYEPQQFFENNIGLYSTNKSLANMFDGRIAIPSAYLEANGNITPNSYYSVSDFLPCNPNSNLICNYTETGRNLFFNFYDINKNHISRIINEDELTTPSNAYYFRLSIENTNISKIKVFENSEIPEDYHHFTDFIRNIPVLHSIPHMSLVRGAITVTNINNQSIKLNVKNGTFIFTDNNFIVLAEQEITIPNNSIILIKKLKAYEDPDNIVRGKIIYYTLSNTINIKTYNDEYFLGFSYNGKCVRDSVFNCFVVDNDGFLTYKDINSAINGLNSTEVGNYNKIYVRNGEYNETLELWNKEIELIGENPEKTIIYNTNGNYSTPPVEAGMGLFENLTIYAKYDGINPTEEWSAYGVHIETNNLSNKTLKFKNCIFKSDFNSSVGLGTRSGAKVIFEDCHFIETSHSNSFCLFMHDSDNPTYYGTSNIIFKNCYFEQQNTQTKALRFTALHQENTTNITMINNSFYNINNPSLNNIDTVNNTGVESPSSWNGLTGYNLLFPSHGNNDNLANY